MKTVYIDGMMCPHCQNRVREILSAFDANVVVDLDNKCAEISENVDNDQITVDIYCFHFLLLSYSVISFKSLYSQSISNNTYGT